MSVTLVISTAFFFINAFFIYFEETLAAGLLLGGSHTSVKYEMMSQLKLMKTADGSHRQCKALCGR